MHIIIRKSFSENKFIYLYDSFEGDIKDKNNQLIATLSYENRANSAKFSIKMGDNILKISEARKHLTGSTGNIFINDLLYAFYDFTPPETFSLPKLFIRNRCGGDILRVEEDYSERRFLWAFRNAATIKDAKKYSDCMHALLIGEKYILASIIAPWRRPLYFGTNKVYSILNISDESIFFSKSIEDQLCILAASCWFLIDRLHPMKSYVAESEIEYSQISSFVYVETNLTLSPNVLQPRSFWIEASVVYPLLAWFWLTGAFFITIIFLPIYYGGFDLDMISFFIYSSIIPIIWIIYSTFENRKANNHITRIENDVNVKSNNEPN